MTVVPLRAEERRDKPHHEAPLEAMRLFLEAAGYELPLVFDIVDCKAHWLGVGVGAYEIRSQGGCGLPEQLSFHQRRISASVWRYSSEKPPLQVCAREGPDHGSRGGGIKYAEHCEAPEIRTQYPVDLGPFIFGRDK